ncbi:hypothetical protein SKAU_G00149080 [Synaphobranchus kaupii]|uniref:Uncharacterized protein n=1 Tax=Synaphobranchus kaupii TaxID=118154 RepID=A0A9Q1J2V2_SYNKA|nr:hypothetical protein SKAU_G00149080 [Synaphobranchus kaupii]
MEAAEEGVPITQDPSNQPEGCYCARIIIRFGRWTRDVKVIKPFLSRAAPRSLKREEAGAARRVKVKGHGKQMGERQGSSVDRPEELGCDL